MALKDPTLEGLIRIAHANPELRAEILPVVKEAKGLAKTPEAAKRMWEKYKKKNPGTRKQPADFYEKPEEGEARKEKSDKEKTKADKGKEKTEKRHEKVKKKVQKDFDKGFEKNWTKKYDQGTDRATINEEVKGMYPHQLEDHVDDLMRNFRAKTPDEALKKLKERYGEEAPWAVYESQAILSRHKKLKREEAKSGKKASFRSKVIRLAHANPELRAKLLPLIKAARG